MHQFITITTLATLLFLVGCGQQQTYLDVEGFSFLSYPVIKSSTSDGISVYTIDNTKTTSGDILTVAHEPIDTNTDLSVRVNSNITTLQQTYPYVEIGDPSETTFVCNEDTIQGTLISGTLPTTPEKDPLYFAQHFFIYGGTGYVFTYSSSHEPSTTSLAKNRQKTRCIQK